MASSGKVALWVGAAVGLLLLLSRKAKASDAPATNVPDIGKPTDANPGLRFVPGSDEQIALFQTAAAQANLPQEWASHPSLIDILKKESGGYVGIPNFLWASWLGIKQSEIYSKADRWPEVWKVIREGNANKDFTGLKSHAAGLGQLQPSGMEKYQPSGLQGIGVPIEEAVGMLRYIADRYGTIDKAAEFWQAHGWY